jgi:phosphoglycerate dehydrogenase-like enzyme
VATRRSATAPPPWVDEQGSSADFERFLPQADVIAICLPLTDETRGLFDAQAFARVKPGAILINVGRGAIVDTDAMLAALESGRLAGACLDVTEPEPLPSDHPLWLLPQVVITPHNSSRAELTGDRREELLFENLRRFGAGEGLLNVVDLSAGY